MAGIIANTASVSMPSSVGADVSKTGYVAGEICTLSAEPAGSAYLWTLAGPPGSQASLSGEMEAAPKFKMDRQGTYVATVVVDATTTYVIRLEATKVTIDWVAHGVRMASVAAASVPTPNTGYIMFINASNADALSLKDSSGTVTAV